MSLEDVCKMLDGKAAVPLWPQAGQALDLKRGATYAAAAAGQIQTLQFGRLKRVPTAWLRAQLGLTESRPAA
jgi:hypothetical protein